ncbi:hypothetical protein TNIN_452221 [Trichonephila inaurata madagascariensis]|uniref:Uncharacterized protein n=1 Tax=Trichonephila inaurata madagascariensis TaxID=2747483 RepID=A0A8X7CPL3_9ARAC|nr:hypothetical protein TNIN_452221 [Trichonephila inaurata madagascariensis]
MFDLIRIKLNSRKLNQGHQVVSTKYIKIKSSLIHQIFSVIMTLPQTRTEAGFNDLSFDDIDELLTDKTLSKGEIIEVFLEPAEPKEHSDKDKDSA